MPLRDLRPYLLAILMTLPGLALRLAPADVSPMLVAYWPAWPSWARPSC